MAEWRIDAVELVTVTKITHSIGSGERGDPIREIIEVWEEGKLLCQIDRHREEWKAKTGQERLADYKDRLVVQRQPMKSTLQDNIIVEGDPRTIDPDDYTFDYKSPGLVLPEEPTVLLESAVAAVKAAQEMKPKPYYTKLSPGDRYRCDLCGFDQAVRHVTNKGFFLEEMHSESCARNEKTGQDVPL